MRKKINIGTSSLVLIFIVLCLATFGLLSITNAKGDMNLAIKNADAVRGYYEADAKGTIFLTEVKSALAHTQKIEGSAQKQEVLKTELGTYYQVEQGLIQTDIPVAFDQALHIELKLTEAMDDYKIQCWKVYNREEYEIDDSIPVWVNETE